MEGEAIGLALTRASELRAKIAVCIDRCCAGTGGAGDAGEGSEGTEDVEVESLAGIRDALESLEHQLAALQDLQQRQIYEREATLSQIDRNRMTLLRKLKEYKGEDLEVIYEATAFAGESMEHDEGLLLPPYPSHLPDLFVLDDLYRSSCFDPQKKLSHNGLTCKSLDGLKKLDESEKNNSHTREGKPVFGLRHFVGFIARSVITVVGVISILSLAGVKPILAKREIHFKVRDMFGKPAEEETQVTIQCPPGRVLVMEDEKPRCLVKERFEIPFESDVTAPNITYGFG